MEAGGIPAQVRYCKARYIAFSGNHESSLRQPDVFINHKMKIRCPQDCGFFDFLLITVSEVRIHHMSACWRGEDL